MRQQLSGGDIPQPQRHRREEYCSRTVGWRECYSQSTAQADQVTVYGECGDCKMLKHRSHAGEKAMRMRGAESQSDMDSMVSRWLL